MTINRKTYIQTQEGLNAYAEKIRNINLPEYGVVFEFKTGIRTTTQNSAMHRYFRLLADALNDAGYDMKKVLKPEVEIPWSVSSVKEFLWRPIQEIITGKESTTKLDRKEVSEVYEPLNRHIASKFGVVVPFPDRNEPQ